MNAPLPLTSTANPFDAWFQPVEALGGLSMMDALYNRLDGAYPHKWRSNFPSPESIDNWRISWAEAFEEEGIRPADIKAGLKACRSRYEWPPSCAEFIKACRPSLDPTVAYYQAIAGIAARARGEMGEWPHPAIYWAAVSMAFELGSQTYSAVKARWERELAAQLERGEWAEIREPVPQIAGPGKGDLSREKASQMVEQLGASGVLTPKTNHRRWAKRILEDEKRKPGTWPGISVRVAREALEAPVA